MKLSDRVSQLRGSATMAVSARAAALRAAGRRVISLGAGEPDFPTPKKVVDAAREACGEVENHRYTSSAGWPALRAAAASALSASSTTPVAEAEVMVTNGAKQAVFLACAALLNSGDEVLLPVPFWTTYPEAVELNGGVTVRVPTSATSGFKVTPEMLEAARTPRTTALIFGSPANPTGALYTPDEVRAIAGWAATHGIWVISDEIYERFVYDDGVFLAMRDAHEAMRDQCLTIHGVSKSFGMTGWRVGWLAGPEAVISAAVNVQSHLSSNVANVAQAAALAALQEGDGHLTEALPAFDRRRSLMWDVLGGLRGVSCVEPKGAFYCFPDVTGLFGTDLNGRVVHSSLELASYILDEALVAVIPGEAFGAPGHLRLSYALADDDLADALARLQRLLGHGVARPHHH